MILKEIKRPLSTPDYERLENYRRAFIQPPAVATLPCAQGPLEAPLDDLACGS